MTLHIDLVRALRESEYREEVSDELESDMTDCVMLEAADKIEGLECDLCSAVEVAWNHGAKDWVRANYRANADLFEQGD